MHHCPLAAFPKLPSIVSPSLRRSPHRRKRRRPPSKRMHSDVRAARHDPYPPAPAVHQIQYFGNGESDEDIPTPAYSLRWGVTERSAGQRADLRDNHGFIFPWYYIACGGPVPYDCDASRRTCIALPPCGDCVVRSPRSPLGGHGTIPLRQLVDARISKVLDQDSTWRHMARRLLTF
ncbi:hypothetical protein CPB85DRAFT_467093 [Mucidula mucida]|nr:hypothetical protein CPB85DRAFT_467093 [Mucidula mucida]